MLHMKIRPVIVFDGAPPMLKRQTLRNRAKTKKHGELQMRKLAEKILLNKIRAQALADTEDGSQARKEGGGHGNKSGAGNSAGASASFDFSNPNKSPHQTAVGSGSTKGSDKAQQRGREGGGNLSDEREEVGCRGGGG